MNTERRKFWWGGGLCLAAAAGALFLGGRHEVEAQTTLPPTPTSQEQAAIFDRAERFEVTVDSVFRSVGGGRRRARQAIVIVSRDGRLLGSRIAPDTWVGAADLAIGKARAAAFFSSNENALTSRIVGQLSQAHDPKTGEGPAGPFWGIWSTNQPSAQFGASVRGGIVTQPGGVPLYRNGQLIGAVGVAGDGVDQDEAVAFRAAAGFLPPGNIATLGFE